VGSLMPYLIEGGRGFHPACADGTIPFYGAWPWESIKYEANLVYLRKIIWPKH
jgi:hypothetical protein